MKRYRKTGQIHGYEYELKIPHKNTPRYLKTVANLRKDGKHLSSKLFDRMFTEEQVIERLIQEYEKQFAPRIGVYKDGVKLAVIIDEDDCIISVNHDDLLYGRISYKKALNNAMKLLQQIEQHKADLHAMEQQLKKEVLNNGVQCK